MEATHKRIIDCDLLFLAKALDANLADFFPVFEPPHMLKEKLRSRRLMVNHASSGAPGKVHRNGHSPPIGSKLGRFKNWKPRST